jgi:hypothetical protein
MNKNSTEIIPVCRIRWFRFTEAFLYKEIEGKKIGTAENFWSEYTVSALVSLEGERIDFETIHLY